MRTHRLTDATLDLRGEPLRLRVIARDERGVATEIQVTYTLQHRLLGIIDTTTRYAKDLDKIITQLGRQHGALFNDLMLLIEMMRGDL